MVTRSRWVVGARDGTRLAAVLERAGADADAIAEGRVFVGRRRARSGDEAVKPGDEVLVSAKVAAPPPVTLLADEDGLVAADKPADIATIPDHADARSSLLASVARVLGGAPGSLHPTSRLDRGVSGVVVFARTAEAAARLRRARDEGTYARRYVAIAASAPACDHGEWDAPIGRASDPRHRAANGREATPARSLYRVVARAGAWALLALDPVTGRTHQLRVHAAHGGAPLVGDRVYGGPSRATLPSGRVLAFDRIALHAARVRVPREDGSTLEIRAPMPALLRDWWRAAGGEGDAGGSDEPWNLALDG